jgi:asparagine synthase (glutamine-hydrolysing)
MHNRQRFHIGSIIWRLSLGAWPLLPYYDRELLDAVTSMPLDYLGGRRMQVDIIKREFPRLATLPLDRNAVGPDYLVTPLYRKFLPPVSEVSWTLYRLLERGRERRYFHRTYDFNAPGWQSVRKEAEQYRPRARNLLNTDALDRLLPAADAKAEYENVVRDASKTKTLVGLVMWYGMNFGQPVDG